MTNSAPSCLSAELLAQIGQNEVSPDELSSIEEHVSGCAHCRELFDDCFTSAQWRHDIRPALFEPREADDFDFAAEREPSGGGWHNESLDGPHCTASLPDLLGPTDDPHMLGRVGGYEVVGVIGQGGMGVVFKGFDRSLNRFVAIKMLLPHLATSGAARRRFAREGQAVAAVVDDHVMAIHCVDQWQGIPYLVMTYSRGVSLQKRLSGNGPLEVAEILRIGMQAAKGLAAAHAQGIVHRDIKPANIFLDENVERVQLMDFGLARAVDDASLTRSGTLAGTPQYMSPEQARGESVDQRSDLFSLGSVLYAMCVGHAPFRAESSYGILRLITDREPRPVREINPGIPEWLCAIISRLMSKQADDRFDSAEQVAELLECCLAHVQQPTTAPLPESVAALGPKHNRRPPFGKFIAAAAFAFSLIFAGVLIVLELNKGTLTIESDLDDIPIRIMQGDRVVEELTIHQSGDSVRIPAGKYVVVIDGEVDGIAVQNGRVSLRRGDTEIVRVIRSGVSTDSSAALSNESRSESDSDFARTRFGDKITVDIYCGADVAPQMNTAGINRAKHVRLLQDLNGINRVTVNFREAGPGNEIFSVMVRDPSLICQSETSRTGKPSTTRVAISAALEAAGVRGVRWEEGDNAQEAEKVAETDDAALTDPRSLSRVTSVYNEDTRQLRLELFDPEIPDLTTEQMRAAMLDAAEAYRRQGRTRIAAALEKSVDIDRLSDGLKFAGMTGTASETFRQIVPALTFNNGPRQVTLVVLSRAELRYSRNGWSSPAWGEVQPPIDGTWELVSIEQRSETPEPESFRRWKQKYASWSRITVHHDSLSMIGDNVERYDFVVDRHAGPLPEFRLSQAGDTKFEGVLMGNGFVDDTELQIAVDLDGKSKPKTFHTDDGRTTKLTYRRAVQERQSSNTTTHDTIGTGVNNSDAMSSSQHQRDLVWEDASVVRLSESFAEKLSLEQDTLAAVNALLTETWTKYIALEYEHTEYSRTPEGYLLAEVGVFSEARDRLTRDFRMKLGKIVSASQREHILALAIARSQALPSLLGWQDKYYPARVQISSGAASFHWYVRPGKHGITGDGRTLPFELEHYLIQSHNKLDGDSDNGP